MNTSTSSSFRVGAVLALGLALATAFVSAPALRAQADSTPSAAANLPSLPLSASFAKASSGDDAPYVLTLKNESTSSVKACAKIVLAVAFHADSKAKMVPAHAIGPGETWTISDLAKGDRVVISADGFAPLQLSVE